MRSIQKHYQHPQTSHLISTELATIWPNPFQPPSVEHFDRVVMKGKKMEKRYHAYGWTTTGWYVKSGIAIEEKMLSGLSVAGS